MDKQRRFKQIKVAVSLALLVCIAALDSWICLKRIQETMPYPRHMDEVFITQRALAILKSNDWNPHEFNYSSYPVYLTTGMLALGYLHHAGAGNKVDISAIKSVSYPYYDPPQILLPARILFALLMVMAFVCMGLAAWRFFDIPEAMFLTPITLTLSIFLLQHGWRYINVDTLAVSMAALTLTIVAFHAGSSSFGLTAILPGMLCGLTVAGKYTYVGIMLPAVLAIWIYGGRWRFYRTLALLASAILMFVIVVPYSILDVRTFVEELGRLAYSYTQGRTGRTYAPGWDHARHYIFFTLKDYGYYSVFPAVAGLVYMSFKNWRGAFILSSFPILLLAHLSLSRLYYERNAAFCFLYYGLLVAVGLFAAYKLLFIVLGKIGYLGTRKVLRAVGASCAIIGVAYLVLPLQRPGQMVSALPDTRNLATEWIKSNLPSGATILMPPELSFYAAPLARKYKMLVRDYALFKPETFVNDALALGVDYVMMPVWASDNGKTKTLSDIKNALNKKIRPLVSYKGNPVGANSTYPVFYGDPAFSIGALK